MIHLNLQDSDFAKGTDISRDNAAPCMYAIDKLRKSFERNEIEHLALTNYSVSQMLECPIWYDVKSLATSYNTPIINKCSVYTSHYIGIYTTSFETWEKDLVKISITPRFGTLFSYLLNYATNTYIAPAELEFKTSSAGRGSYWLLGLLWRSMLKKALTEGMIPKEYVRVTENRKSFKGHLCVQQQIHLNLIDKSRFVCRYKKISLDNTINRTIRYTFKLLSDIHLDGITKEFYEYDKRLESLGVSHEEVSLDEINKVRYSKLTAPYESFMRVCKSIISQHRVEAAGYSKKSFSFFIDIAELWEAYLLKLLKSNLTGYRVYSPNVRHGDFLLENSIREIRPDIIIEKDGHPIIIIDAKYKQYSHFGANASNGISRDDLYQMNTYLYHYGKDKKIIGIFTSPSSSEKETELYKYSTHPLHSIGLVNLCIKECEDNISKIKEQEKKYIKDIKELLSSFE